MELLNVGVRCVGVVLPAAVLLGFVEVRGGAQDGDLGTFVGAMALSLLAALVWAARDASRTPTARAISRWIATALLVGAGLGIATTLLAPGSPPEDRPAEAVDTSLFYGVPLLVAAGGGVLIGAALRQEAAGRADRSGESGG